MNNVMNIVKITILGDYGVGKTSMLNKLMLNKYDESEASTIGVSFSCKVFDVLGEKLKCQFWDLAGQERFRSICDIYLRNVQCVIIVFDISNNDSFKNCSYWLKYLDDKLIGPTVKILIGTKKDLIRSVSYETIKNYADLNNLSYFEISSKKDNNINIVFQSIAEIIRNNIVNGKIMIDYRLIEKVDITKNTKKYYCC